MSRPDPRQQAAAMPAAFAGAIDLSALKKRASAPAPGLAAPGGAPVGAANGTPAEAPPVSPYIVDVDEGTFSVLQASSQVLVVVHLWAAWAEPALQLTPILERLAAAAGGSWILAKVDVDANPRIAQAFGVQTLPMVIALAQGQPVTEPLTAALPEPQVGQWVAGLLDALRDHLPGIRAAEAQNPQSAVAREPEPEDPRFIAAEDALAQGDYAAAELAYQQILAVEPGNLEAKAALAQTGLLSRVEKLTPDVIARADAAPDDVQAQCDAADLQLASGDIDGAFARLIATVRRTVAEDRAAAREHLVELFSLFPPDEEQVIKARRALAAALY